MSILHRHWSPMDGVDTMRRWWRYGERCPRVWREGTTSDQEATPSGLGQHLQVVKQRENGRVVGVKAKTIYGDEREVLCLLGQSTSYVERTNLTARAT